MIDTTKNDVILISLFSPEGLYEKKIKSAQKHSDKLLSAIDSLLNELSVSLSQIKEIKVQSRGGSFNSLRVGVITANALAYALKIPVSTINDDEISVNNDFNIVSPDYQSEPNIGPPKKISC